MTNDVPSSALGMNQNRTGSIPSPQMALVNVERDDDALPSPMTTPNSADENTIPVFITPQEIDGVIWRELISTDVAALSALVARIEARDNPPYRTSPEEITGMLDPSGAWYGMAAFATLGVERGRMIAFTHIEMRPGSTTEVLCQGGVDPHFRRLGIGGALVRWQTQAAQRVLEAHGTETGSVVMSMDPNHSELEQHLKDNGYRWSRSFNEMRADLRSLPQTSEIEPYLIVEPWSEKWEEPVRSKVNSLAAQIGADSLSAEDWVKGRIGFVPEWSFVAYDTRGDRPRIAGYLHASKYEQDWAVLGWREGYIDTLTVFNEWRHGGLAEALIIASMHAQRLDGMERTGTGISSEGQSEAQNLYDFLGFRTVGQLRLYTKTISVKAE